MIIEINYLHILPLLVLEKLGESVLGVCCGTQADLLRLSRALASIHIENYRAHALLCFSCDLSCLLLCLIVLT